MTPNYETEQSPYVNPRFESRAPSFEGSTSTPLLHPALQMQQTPFESFGTNVPAPSVLPEAIGSIQQSPVGSPLSTLEGSPNYQNVWGQRSTVGSFPGYTSPVTSGRSLAGTGQVPTTQTPQMWGPGWGANQRTMGPSPLGATPQVGTQALWNPALATGEFGQIGQIGQLAPTIRQPSIDLFDEGEDLIFEIELPGVAKGDVNLVCDEFGLSVKAKTTPQHEEEQLLQAERGNVIYQRYIPIRVAVVPDKIAAKFKDGILSVTVPKKEPTSGPHKVEIK